MAKNIYKTQIEPVEQEDKQMSKDELIAALQKEIATFRGDSVTEFGQVIGDLKTPIEAPAASKVTPASSIQLAGGESFTQALANLDSGAGIRPETQAILDELRKQSEIDIKGRVSTAQSFAEKRGLEGSAIEQGAVGQAITEGERARSAAELPYLAADLEAKQQEKMARTEALLGRAETEADASFQAAVLDAGMEQEMSKLMVGITAEERQLMANLKSDELASIRNLIESGKNRELQKYLGERGVAVSTSNIEAAKEIAESNAQTSIWSSVVGSGITAVALPF